MFFHEILEAQPDPIFGLNEAFQADIRPNKVNLIIGIYKDEQLRPYLMPSVAKIKKWQKPTFQHQLRHFFPLR